MSDWLAYMPEDTEYFKVVFRRYPDEFSDAELLEACNGQWYTDHLGGVLERLARARGLEPVMVKQERVYAR